MSHLTYIELESLRHLVGECQLKAKKLSVYAQQCQNNDLKSWCQREADSANQSVRSLMSFLSEGVGLQ